MTDRAKTWCAACAMYADGGCRHLLGPAYCPYREARAKAGPATQAPWLQPVGVCPSCDRRRATGAAEARKQRERRAKQKEESSDG